MVKQFFLSADPIYNTSLIRNACLAKLQIDPVISIYDPLSLVYDSDTLVILSFDVDYPYYGDEFDLLLTIVNIFLFNSSPSDKTRSIVTNISPTPSYDYQLNFIPGSFWLNTNTQEVFYCHDDSLDNAVWLTLPSISYNGSGSGEINDIPPYDGTVLQFNDSQELWVTQPGKWSSCSVSSLSMTKNGINDPVLSTFSSGLFSYLFVNGSDKELFFNIIIPNQYQEGTDIYPVIHYAPSTNTGGDIVWSIEYFWSNPGDTISSTTTISETSPVPTVTNEHSIVEFTPISGTLKKINSILSCRIFRNGTNINDTYSDGAFLLYVDFQFIQSGTGSTQFLIK